MREFMRRHPDYSCIAVDCRGHGDSAVLTANQPLGSNTVRRTAEDLQALLTQLGTDPDLVFGHSFGGKVALELLSIRMHTHGVVPRQTWVLDSIPSRYSDSDHASPNSVSNILRTIAFLPTTFESREWMQKELQSKGVLPPIALWLSTNVIQSDKNDLSGSTWCFDIKVIRALFEDFCESDLVPLVDSFPNGQSTSVHFIRAGKNKAWELFGSLAILETIGLRNPAVRVHTMPHVGHWLHVEDLHGMLDIVDENAF